MPNIKKIQLSATLPTELGNLRLDQALAKLFPDYSRSRLQSWIKQQHVTVDGKHLKAKDKIQPGQMIEVHASLEEQIAWQAQQMDLNIIYEDESIIVINKPPGLVVHPAVGNPDQTLVNALLHYAPELAQLPRAGIVHRLDKNTSGLMVVARNLEAHHWLVKQIQARKVKREYLAVVNGRIISGGTIEAPIGRHHVHRTQMAVTDSGKEAVTHYWVKERFKDHTLLKILLETGRTHQIRVHMAYIHHPIVGDTTYGGRLKIPAGCSEQFKEALRHFRRQALHAWRLSLQHPVNGKLMEWQADVPEDMLRLIETLKVG
jgi:23S rRNA pseudouridine1911/1915/1917 synthase